MRTKTEKLEIVEALAERFKRAKIAIFTDFHGTSVAKAMRLRRLLRENNGEYKVAKKTLLDRALEKLGISLRTKELKGEIGVAFGYGDLIAPAKTLLNFIRENEHFRILGGILENKILRGDEVLTLAKLPPREVILAKLLGALQSPFRGLVTILGGNIKNLVVVLNKIKDKE